MQPIILAFTYIYIYIYYFIVVSKNMRSIIKMKCQNPWESERNNAVQIQDQKRNKSKNQTKSNMFLHW